MKKIISAMLAVLILMLAGCGSNKDENPIVKTENTPKSADMLNITAKGKNYSDCVKRYYSVLTAVKNKTQILEKEHNKKIEAENPDKFFLDENYIMTAFEPFVLTDFLITENFNPSLTEEEIAQAFSYKINGDSVSFENSGDNVFKLSLINEVSLREFNVTYSSQDSFRYVSTTESGETTIMNEMLEFGYNSDTYYVQSKTSRLYVQFDDNGNIIYFCCSTLKNGSYDADSSIYPSVTPSKEWVTDRDKDEYISIHTYENDILTHEDCSSGPWKTLRINENDYQNAFPLQ